MGRRVRSEIGTIDQRGPGVWRIRVQCGNNSDGSPNVLSETVRGTRRDAELMRARLALRSGRGGSPLKGLTIYEFVSEAWLPTKSHLRESTLRGYRSTIDTHIQTHFGNVRLDGALSYTIAQRLDDIQPAGAALNVYKVLRSAFKFATQHGFIDINPMPSVAVPRIEKKSAEAQTHDVYSPDEVRDLLGYFHGDEIEAAVIMALTCGLRRSEICALDWNDLTLPDNGQGSLVVRRGYHGSGCFEEPKSQRSRRTVAIPPSATARLLAIRGPHAAIGPMLIARRGGRLSPDSLTGRWHLLMGHRLKSDGTPLHKPPVRYLPFKNLRHTHATITLGAGVDVVDVSRRLGHSSVSVTDAFYLRPGRAADQAAADAFDGTFARAMQQQSIRMQ